MSPHSALGHAILSPSASGSEVALTAIPNALRTCTVSSGTSTSISAWIARIPLRSTLPRSASGPTMKPGTSTK